MIERLRRGAQSGLSYILIGVLIVFFAVFFGVPADGCMAGDGQRNLMASVDGEDIFTEEVNIIQNRMFRQDRQRQRQQDEEYFSQQAEALRIVMAIHLLANRAEQAGLRVSDDEFRQFMTDPVRNFEFQMAYGRTGQFDGEFYERYVEGRLRTPITSYEEFKRRELLARKYLAMLDMQAHVSDAEIEELHQLRNTRVNLEYVRFDQDSLIDIIGLDDDDIEEFLADEEGLQRVEEYYEEHRDDYVEPEEVKLRMIQIFKDDEDPEVEDRFQEARTRVIDEGEDFGLVAQELSEDFYREDGGLMDWTTLDNVSPEVAEAVEGAGVGDIVEPDSDSAFILVKLEDRQDEQVEDLEDVKHEIAETILRRDVVETRGLELAETLHQRLAEGLSIDDALEALEEEALDDEREQDAEIWAALSADTTGFFTLEEEEEFPMMQQPGMDMSDFLSAWYEVPGIGEHQELAVAAFRADEDNPLIEEIFEVEDARVVARLAEREDPDEITDEERAELAFEAQLEKSSALLGDWRTFFLQPTEELAEYIDAVLMEGMEDGSIRLFERNSRAASLVRHMLEGAEDVDVEEVIDLPEEPETPGIDELDPDEDDDAPDPADAPGPGQ